MNWKIIFQNEKVVRRQSVLIRPQVLHEHLFIFNSFDPLTIV